MRGDTPDPDGPALVRALAGYRARSAREAADLARGRELARSPLAWSRTAPLHVTASAVVVHPPSARVLLRWHDRLGRWLHVGGHADAGEDDPWAVAQREAREETGLEDLAAWPDAPRPEVAHLAVVAVPAVGADPAHEHLDLRYLMATSQPGSARAELSTTRLRWAGLEEAAEAVGGDDLVVAFGRVAERLADVPGAGKTT